MLLRPTRQLFFCLLLSLCIILQGCASTKEPKSGLKVGMHIDAVLEFNVAYPLSWNKDRRITYGSKEGEVRWTHPDHPNTLLTIRSDFQKRHDLSKEQRIDQALHEYIGLEVTTSEKMTLPDGEAWHVTGHTAQVNVDIYLFFHTDRSYLIALTAPADNIDNFKHLMERVTRSFQAIPQKATGYQEGNESMTNLIHHRVTESSERIKTF